MQIAGWAVVLTLLLGGLAAPVDGSEVSTVYVLPVQGELDPGLARFVERAVREARSLGARAILVEVSTLGGRLDATLDIYDALVTSGIPVHVVILDRAWSGGVLISLGGETLWMMSGTSIGAAEPRPLDEKALSAWRG